MERTMSANAYTKIAERYQVPASDDEAVERFFLDVAPTLSREEREAIVAELRGDELAAATTFDTTDLPLDVPTFSIDEAPPITRPSSLAQLVGELSAAVEKRVSDRLDRIARTLDRLQEQRASSITPIHARQIADLIDGRTLVHADSQENVRNVVRRMTEANVGAVAVLDQGKLVGVFSERDVMMRVVARGLDPDATSVSSVMTKEIVVADPQEDINNALQKMRSVGCRHLPVVMNGNLVGMISIRDLVPIGGDIDRENVTIYDMLGLPTNT